MEKKLLQDLLRNGVKRVSSVPGESDVYLLRDGNYLKVFTDDFVLANETYNGNALEKKILEADQLHLPYQIKKPIVAGYDYSGLFKAYVTPAFVGDDLSRYFHELGFFDQMLPETYTKRLRYLEKIIKDANKEGVVFPDLCSEGNVLYNPRGVLGLIDYDGLQIGDDRSIVFLSSALGDSRQYENSKYKLDGLYTPQLDRKSMIILYFANAFDLDLSDVGQINPSTGRVITVDEKMDQINMHDEDVRNLVRTAFSSHGYNGSIIEAVEKFDYENSIFFQDEGKKLIKGRIRF